MEIENEADKWNDKGIDYYNSGKYDEAIKCFDKIIKKYPNYVWALHNKGIALYELGKYDESIKYYDRVLEKDPNFVDAWNSKGVSLINLEKFDEGVECYKKAIEIDPNYSVSLVNLGNSYSNLKNYSEAFKFYDKAIEKDPNYVLAWDNKGLAFYNLKNYVEAINCFDKVIENDPNNIEVWIKKASALYNIGNYSEAERCYDEAFKLDPKNIDATRELILIYSSFKQEYDKALQKSQLLLEINPDFDAKATMAEVLILIGRYEEGRKYAIQALFEAHNAFNKCLTRLLIISSYLLEDDAANCSEEYAKFFNSYKNIDKDYKFGEDEEEGWHFGGLINVIGKSDINLQTKFLLLTVIDLMRGKVDKQKLSFFSEDSM